MNEIAEAVKSTCVSHINENQYKIHAALDRLSEEDVWWRPNPESNSIGNILLHLSGNIRQYILSTLDGAEDFRQRSEEFSAKGPILKQKLMQNLDETLLSACTIISSLSEEGLLKKRSVQVYEKTGVEILIHVTEHLSYHTGQIIYFTKWLKGRDMGFYDDKALE